MKQINNGFDERYYLTKGGEVYDSTRDKYKKADKQHVFKLRTVEGKYKKISLRPLYKLVYDEIYVIDNTEDLEGEEWKAIDRTDNIYWISDKGRVKSYASYEAKILKPYINNGYERVDIYQDGSRSTKSVNRLVAAAFLLPPKYIDMQLHHKNRNRADNRKENLVWLTAAEHREIHRKLNKEQ